MDLSLWNIKNEQTKIKQMKQQLQAVPDISVSYRIHCQLLSNPTTHSSHPRGVLDDQMTTG